MTREVITKFYKKIFPEGKKRWPELMEEARQWRMRLLDKRTDLRGQKGGEEYERVQMMLKKVSALLQEAR